jgi:hypothetical protein
LLDGSAPATGGAVERARRPIQGDAHALDRALVVQRAGTHRPLAKRLAADARRGEADVEDAVEVNRGEAVPAARREVTL